MWRTLVFLALAVASCTPASHKMADDAISSISPRDMSLTRFRGIRKTGQSAQERSGEEIPGEQTIETGEDEAPRGISKADLYGLSGKKGRKQKVFFVNYPFVPPVRRRQQPSSLQSPKNRNDIATTERKPGHRKRLQQDSPIYYIRLPPTPYIYVPGLGYISQPPSYSTPALQRPVVNNQPQRPNRPPKPTVKPFVNVPIDFVSNGKPTGVYLWPGGKKKENSLNSLDKGPYVFNGKPTSLYLLTPDGQKTGHQPIRLPDYSGKGYYS